jgi:AraC-like DNA-binding protein
MITELIENKRNFPDVLVENKVSFSGPDSELSIYDTYKQASQVKLKSDQLLFCSMVTGKKVVHAEKDHYHSEFLPHESFIMAPNKTIEIDFPIAELKQPTTCLAIEISTDKIKKIAGELNQSTPKDKVFGHWQYDENLIHSHHNSDTQELLNRIVKIYTENHQDRSYMIDLAVSELTVRLLRHQSRDFMLSFCQNEPDNNGLSAALSYIYQHISDHLDINHLCRLACMSRTKFFNKFKTHLGCTPIAFQHQIRLKQAANMIKNGQPITAVCFELGFSNASHFSRSFKLFYGLSPREYKIRNSLLIN